MGSCLSSWSAGSPAAADGAPAMEPAAASSRARISSESWKERKKQKKRGGSGGELGKDELHRVPGRMILNGASDVACLFTQQGRKGTNQDAMIVWEVSAAELM